MASPTRCIFLQTIDMGLGPIPRATCNPFLFLVERRAARCTSKERLGVWDGRLSPKGDSASGFRMGQLSVSSRAAPVGGAVLVLHGSFPGMGNSAPRVGPRAGRRVPRVTKEVAQYESACRQRRTDLPDGRVERQAVVGDWRSSWGELPTFGEGIFFSFAAAESARLMFVGSNRHTRPACAHWPGKVPSSAVQFDTQSRCKCCEVRREDALGVSWCTWESCQGWALAD